MFQTANQWGFTKFTALAMGDAEIYGWLSHQHLHQFEDFPASHYPIIPLFSLYKNHITPY
jgi:hypothetical protein